MDVTTQRCDVCRRLKAEANHWFAAFSAPGWFIVLQPSARNTPRFPKTKNLDLCSESCVIKAMSKAIGVQS